MTAVARLLEQRSIGHVRLRVERDGIAVMREAGSAKCRMPRGSNEAILINTSGGLAGGDLMQVDAEAGDGATLALTTQAAERVYRTLGPAAEVRVNLRAEKGAHLFWIPQETILFDNAALGRKLSVELAEGSRFLAVEPMVFGRKEMGEKVGRISVTDRWEIRRSGRLIHAEAFQMQPAMAESPTTLAGNSAAATVVFIADEADQLLDAIRQVLGPQDGASAWNGKLVARLLAKDGFALRKVLVPVLSLCVGRWGLPKCWTF
jgi:urease accessory protein